MQNEIELGKVDMAADDIVFDPAPQHTDRGEYVLHVTTRGETIALRQAASAEVFARFHAYYDANADVKRAHVAGEGKHEWLIAPTELQSGGYEATLVLSRRSTPREPCGPERPAGGGGSYTATMVSTLGGANGGASLVTRTAARSCSTNG